MKVYEQKAGDYGVDFVVEVGKRVKILQFTDMQFIDAEQRRYPDRLRQDEIVAWAPDMLDAQCGNQMRALVAQTCPDLIFITGDMVYGSFDDSGSSFKYFVDLMESFSIPWAPVFGNHDNESKMGVDWQCKMMEEAEHCLFSRGTVTGNCNYTVGIVQNGKLIRVLYMIDSNGCCDCDDPKVEKEEGIFPDQMEWIERTAQNIDEINGKVPSFMAFHAPTQEFLDVEEAKGYRTKDRRRYTIGVDVESKDGDFGCRLSNLIPAKADGMTTAMTKAHVDGVFVGHYHSINTCITYNGVKYVYGLKTGQYDSHIAGQTGGTLIRLDGADMEIYHIAAIAPFAPYPTGGAMHKNYFVKVDE